MTLFQRVIPTTATENASHASTGCISYTAGFVTGCLGSLPELTRAPSISLGAGLAPTVTARLGALAFWLHGLLLVACVVVLLKCDSRSLVPSWLSTGKFLTGALMIPRAFCSSDLPLSDYVRRRTRQRQMTCTNNAPSLFSASTPRRPRALDSSREGNLCTPSCFSLDSIPVILTESETASDPVWARSSRKGFAALASTFLEPMLLSRSSLARLISPRSSMNSADADVGAIFGARGGYIRTKLLNPTRLHRDKIPTTYPPLSLHKTRAQRSSPRGGLHTYEFKGGVDAL
ncbi:hypothetical protein B0H13DRAFT_2490036 [Mycena leptocephala]|nr:hypothetical protein B0H13DRAFT_2490036 [Mycena leptocephala]